MGLGAVAKSPWTKFKNYTGSDVLPYSVLRVDDFEIVENALVVVGNTPSTTFTRDYIVVGPYKVKSSKYGICFAGDEVLVRYDTGTPAIGDAYGPVPGEYTLSKNYPQTAICRGVVDEDNKIMLARWMPIGGMFAKANGSISAGSNGAISICQGTLGSHAAIDSMDPTSDNAGPDVVLNDELLVDFVNGQMVFMKRCT